MGNWSRLSSEFSFLECYGHFQVNKWHLLGRMKDEKKETEKKSTTQVFLHPSFSQSSNE